MSKLEKVAIDLLRAEAKSDRARAEAEASAVELIQVAAEGISLRELARRTGLSVSYLSAVQTGRQKISSNAFVRIAGMKFAKVKLNAYALDEERRLDAGGKQ
jgi:hypothetical protein